MRRLVLALLGALVLVSCSQEPDGDNTTGAICPAKRFPLDPKNLKQCVDACIACDSGTTMTCTTSCYLKGAR